MDTIWSKQLTEQMLSVLTDQHKQHGQVSFKIVKQSNPWLSAGPQCSCTKTKRSLLVTSSLGA